MLYLVAVISTIIIGNRAQEGDRCEPLTIDTCAEFGYSSVRFPNEMDQNSQEAAANDLQVLQRFIDTGCSKDLKLFLCSLYAPYCNAASLEQRIMPCRDLCLNVRDRCLATMQEKDYEWPNSWKCGRFPSEKGMCVEGIESPVTEPPPEHSTEHEIKATSKMPTVEPEQKPEITDTVVVDNSNNMCRQDQIYCDGMCKPISFRCDAFQDCTDGSDEMDCDKCLSNQFRCADKSQCVPLPSRCDAIRDCTDGSDEVDCNSCGGNEFRCDRDRCLSNQFKCDGRVDCRDGTDEANCDACAADQFHCATLNRCISSTLKCDGEDDCGDNSDELPETAGCAAPVEPTQPAPTEERSGQEDEETDEEDNKGTYQFTQCTDATRDCDLDPDCKKEMTNYRLECEAMMRSDKMIICTQACQLAYNRLLSRRPHGEAIIDRECDELGVKNVKLSCIREAMSMTCARELNVCFRDTVCKELHSKYVDACEETVAEHAQCTNDCRNAYRAFVKSPTSKGMLATCIEFNTTIPVRCGAMTQAVENAAPSKSSCSHGQYAVLLTLSLFFILFNSR